jgi:PPK2 family polyphosphate:nucleotide phosphotransferase
MQDFAKNLSKASGFSLERLIAKPGKKISLAKDFDPAYSGDFETKDEAEGGLQQNVEELSEEQDKLYASDKYSLLLVLQAMDAAGKDSTIKHVMSGVNPQGCEVFSFKAPSAEDLDHDYLRRASVRLPSRGRIGIFNRSYYEEVIITRVHPEILTKQHLPNLPKGDAIFKRRYEEINDFEQYLTQNGIIVLKFFLNVSKAEQKKRFLKRIEEKEKNWKFSANDIHERQYWDKYQEAFEEAFNHTSTKWAPWFIVPADRKWFTRLAVSEIIIATLRLLKLEYPKMTEEAAGALEAAKQTLLNES